MVLIFFKKNRVIFSKYVSFFDTRNKKNVKKGHRILRGWTEAQLDQITETRQKQNLKNS